jgi:hypothetical protein
VTKRIFTVEVDGVPDDIADFDLRTAIATGIGRFLREHGVPGGYLVGTSGGILPNQTGE